MREGDARKLPATDMAWASKCPAACFKPSPIVTSTTARRDLQCVLCRPFIVVLSDDLSLFTIQDARREPVSAPGSTCSKY